MRFFIVVSLFFLAGCQTTVNGSEAGGVASFYGLDPAPGVQAANDHCQKYGRVAQPTQYQKGNLTFSCVKPGS